MDLTSRKTWIGLAVVVGLLAGCSSTSLTRAPVEERNVDSMAIATVDPTTLPGYENAGKPGYYTVRQGDTIMGIARAVNHPWRDIAAWNNLENPNVIEVGQVLRVVAPAAVGTGVTTPITAGSEPPRSGAPAAAEGAKPAIPVATQTTPETTAAPPAAQPPAPPPPPPSAGADDVKFIWPARGPVVAAFNEASNKGVGIGGKAGDPVLAAADGRVVYAGAGLRGYGNLVILKHNDTFLTAYAHNQKLLVKEDQNVKKGQKIAEMGSTDADRVKLHFEIRRSGKPVDPMRYLPAR